MIQQSSVPEGWREVKLGDVAEEIVMGQSPKSETYNTTRDGMPFYQGVVDFGDIFVTPRIYCSAPKKVINAGTILLSVRAPVGRVNMTREQCSIGRGNCGLKTEKNNQRFLFYLLKASEAQFENSASGTVFSSVSSGDIKGIEILLPPLPEQKAIAEVLSSLDDKIDLLHRQNTTLENIAQTLFRKWFVEDAGDDWEEVELGETVNIAIGRTPPRKEHEWFSKKPDDWKWVSIKDMGKCGVYIFDTAEYLTQAAVEKYNIPVIPNKTVILSFKMTLGRVGITTEDMLSNEAIAHFKFRPDTPYSREYLYFFLKLFKFASLGSTSSIVTSINTEMIRSFKIPIPDAESMSKFEGIGKLLFEGIHSNQSQIRTLENLRNLLLPKLMSGKVRMEHITHDR